MASARIRLPPELEGTHLFVLEDCIIQANLGERDRKMVRRYLIARTAQADLAAEFGCSRTTVSKHLKRSIEKIADVNRRLYKKFK